MGAPGSSGSSGYQRSQVCGLGGAQRKSSKRPLVIPRMSKLNLTAAFPGVEPLPQADLTRIRIGGRQVNEYLGVEFRRTLGAQRARLDRPRLQVRLLEAGEAASRDGAAAAS